MKNALSRRHLLLASAAALPTIGLVRPLTAQAASGVDDGFPAGLRQRVYDTVLYAHSDIEKVRQLVEASPALANSAMDWGFGDWETALGAASHMGRRDMAELLISHGARPDLFTHAMLGHLDAVKALVAALPGSQGFAGPHGITLLSHAKAGGPPAAPVVSYLEELGGADLAEASVPLELEPEAYHGSYSWPEDAGNPLVVDARRNGALGIKRGKGFGRSLQHLGDHAFHPGGSPAVRIRFTVSDGKVTGLSVWDGDKILDTTRQP